MLDRPLCNLRLSRRKAERTVTDYVSRAQKAIVFQAAAQAWANGVPWAKALSFSEEALKQASAAPKRRAAAKAKAKARSR